MLDNTLAHTVELMENQSLQSQQTLLQARIVEVSNIAITFWKEKGWLKGNLVHGDSVDTHSVIMSGNSGYFIILSLN